MTEKAGSENCGNKMFKVTTFKVFFKATFLSAKCISMKEAQVFTSTVDRSIYWFRDYLVM